MSTVATVQVTSKSMWASKTLWANALALVLLLADILTELQLPLVTTEQFAAALALVNIALRFLTDRPVRPTQQLVVVPVAPPGSAA